MPCRASDHETSLLPCIRFERRGLANGIRIHQEGARCLAQFNVARLLLRGLHAAAVCVRPSGGTAAGATSASFFASSRLSRPPPLPWNSSTGMEARLHKLASASARAGDDNSRGSAQNVLGDSSACGVTNSFIVLGERWDRTRPR